MSIYLIARTDSVRYDEMDSVVVIAATEDQARDVAKQAGGDQLPAVWDNATVTVVDPDGEPSIVLGDFNAG
jgi:hypothetical protein